MGKSKSAISGEKVLMKKLRQAEDALEVQRRRLLLKDQEILGYQRKLELALIVPQIGRALPQGEAWDLTMPRVKTEYQEQTSFSLSASSISKDEYIVEELSAVIKEEEKGN